MNPGLMALEIGVILAGLTLLLIDLWTPGEKKSALGYLAAGALGLVLAGSFFISVEEPRYAFQGMYVLDGMAMFFKRLFLVAGIFVLIMTVDFSRRLGSGIVEFYALTLFALAGMMVAASANDFVLVFVALEVITITFYILTSFQRRQLQSLEAGVKYLILGATSTAFTVYGIALIFGTANSTSFERIQEIGWALSGDTVFVMGMLLVLAGLGFKIAAFPFQIWAPDVYQGAPTPATAFLAVGSKAAGFAVLLRVLFGAVPEVAVNWTQLLMLMSGITILYGNLCAIPQRNLKRLLGYSSIAHAGYMLLGVAAMSLAGSSAVLYYLGAYLFTVLAAFLVLCVVLREIEGEDISALSGLHHRSPLLAVSMTLAMVSLAGVPPLAGFFGKFLLLKAVVEQGGMDPAYYALILVAIIGVAISFYYYLGVVRAIYWGEAPATISPIAVSNPMQAGLYGCVAGMLYLGIFPENVVNLAQEAARVLKL
jgi:NADH-quinone oxidoreductase subunit N